MIASPQERYLNHLSIDYPWVALGTVPAQLEFIRPLCCRWSGTPIEWCGWSTFSLTHVLQLTFVRRKYRFPFIACGRSNGSRRDSSQCRQTSYQNHRRAMWRVSVAGISPVTCTGWFSRAVVSIAGSPLAHIFSLSSVFMIQLIRMRWKEDRSTKGKSLPHFFI